VLLDGNGWGEVADTVVFGFVHLAEELLRVGRELLNVASLPPGEQRIERERLLTPSGHPVKTTRLFFGMSTLADLRLCSRAPRMATWSSAMTRGCYPHHAGCADHDGTGR